MQSNICNVAEEWFKFTGDDYIDVKDEEEDVIDYFLHLTYVAYYSWYEEVYIERGYNEEVMNDI